MSNFSEVEAKFLLTSFPKSCTSPETWNDLMKETCWSFNSLVKGVGPTHDSSEKPLKKGSPFYEKSGQPLATGHRAATSAIQGDADFFLATTYFYHIGHPTFLARNAIAGKVGLAHPSVSRP